MKVKTLLELTNEELLEQQRDILESIIHRYTANMDLVYRANSALQGLEILQKRLEER